MFSKCCVVNLFIPKRASIYLTFSENVEIFTRGLSLQFLVWDGFKRKKRDFNCFHVFILF